ncbi:MULTISPECIES: Cof-type HAD-IIB family hydrolase [Bacillus cereus group]|uniref:Cof-type HAD-IIB family hydrolase n=1 Tax=Bacillus cereus group TaxID=86661 RepID=UPI000279DF26|nr:Cof-type HAD-IIB family hydrolase [Bacillus cereus]EJR82694.1 cof-like hydrolase [Bacillus cereus VD169]MDZ4619143.1 Cof-type HAD-IIB family hydrolase [Bacillus cereus]
MNNQTYQVAILDLDGTIVKYDENYVSERTLSCLEKWKECGNQIGIATGRTWIECQQLVDIIQPSWPVICYDGRLIYDYKKNEVIWKQTISNSKVQQIISAFQDDFYIFQEEMSSIYAFDQISALLFSMAFKVNRKKIKFGSQPKSNPFRLYIKSKNKYNSFSFEMESKIRKLLGEKYEVFLAGDEWLIIYIKETNKLTAIQMLTKYYKVSMAQIIAFGDGENDLNMLQNVGLGVAMKNANSEIKNAANLVADTVDNDGVAKIISNLLK